MGTPFWQSMSDSRDRYKARCKSLAAENKRLREALAVAAEACRVNLVFAQAKDEQALLTGYETAQAALKK